MSKQMKIQDTEAPNAEAQAQLDSNKYPDEVTFVWNRSAKEIIIVMTTASVMFTDTGPVSDPRKPAKRLKVKNGLYSTSGRDEIEFLTGHPEFNSKGRDGFSILKKITPKDDLNSVMKRHNITKAQIVEMANKG